MHRLWNTIVEPFITEIKPRHIVEVGSENGFNTERLLKYCVENNAKISCIDPFPLFDVDGFKKKYGDKFEMFEGLSLDILPLIEDYDLILLDGDHNWYTIYHELKLIEEQFKEKKFPIAILHDISWPYARRDLYYNPDTIPKEYLNPYEKKGMCPGKNDLLEYGGANYNLFNAINENTPKNGVLTGVEDFLNESNLDLTFKIINAFHGLGIIYPKNSEIHDIIEQILSKSNLLGILEQHYLKNIIVNEINYQKTIDKLNNDIHSTVSDIDRLNSIIHENNRVIEDLRNANTELKKENDKQKNNLNQQNIKIQKLESKNQDLINENKEILSSNSWKVTKPLRKLKNLK